VLYGGRGGRHGNWRERNDGLNGVKQREMICVKNAGPSDGQNVRPNVKNAGLNDRPNVKSRKKLNPNLEKSRRNVRIKRSNLKKTRPHFRRNVRLSVKNEGLAERKERVNLMLKPERGYMWQILTKRDSRPMK
jgi:hypothetical protein